MPVSVSQSRSSPAIAKKTPSPTVTSASSAKVKTKPFVSPASPSSYRHVRAKVVSHQQQQQQTCEKFGNQSTISRISSDGSLSLSQGDMKDVSRTSVSSVSSVASSRSRQVAFASPKVMIRPGTGAAVKRGFQTPDSSRSTLNSTPTGRPATGPRTPAKGSRANALGYKKKTPGSVGSNNSGKRGARAGATKTATTAQDSNSRSYNKDLNLKPNDVLQLLTTIKSRDLAAGDPGENEITLRELLPKDPQSEKPACSSNLMGAFNVFSGKTLSHKHVDADQSVSSTCTLDQRLEDLSMDEKLSERLEASILDESQSNSLSNYRALLNQINHESEDFVEKYTQHAKSIYFARRKQLLDPNTVVNAEKSLNRLNDAVGKLSTSTTKEYQILRQNMAYQGESIPCPFEERSQFVQNLERYDKTMSYGKPALFPQTLEGDGNQTQGQLEEIENDLGDQLSKLKLQLDQLETSNEKLSAQNERTSKSLTRYHESRM